VRHVTLAAALVYADKFCWPVFPCKPWPDKAPYQPGGFHNATLNPAHIRAWWKRWPHAAVAIPTGQPSKVVVFDVDTKVDAKNGVDSLAELGVSILPQTAISHTGSGGFHLFFDPGDRIIPSTRDEIAIGIDIRGDGGYALIPPSPGYSWDPHWNLETVPLAPAPEWLVPPERARRPPPKPLRRPVNLSRYAAVALDRACKAIRDAGNGDQEKTMGREAYGIGQLVGAGLIGRGFAVQELLKAGYDIPDYNPQRRWKSEQIERRIKNSLADGIARPREFRHG
jgi:hypothetical protein